MAATITPLPRRRRRTAATPLFPADVEVFPFSSNEVERFAETLRALPSAQRNQRMVARIEYEWNRLCDARVDEEKAKRTLINFANAVWATLGGIQRGGVA